MNLNQKNFNYPKSLNMGFEVAHYNDVLTLVGHSTLTNKASLLVAQRYTNNQDIAGIFGWALPNSNASLTERLFCAFSRQPRFVSKKAHTRTSVSPGIMGANCSIVNKHVWRELGGYSNEFAVGGEDLDFADRAFIQCYKIVGDPALSVYHTHGLKFTDFVR